MNNLVQGTFLKRYKRFFADVQLPNGEIVVAHVPNTGSMKSCIEPGWTALLSPAKDPNRKLKYTLEYLKSPNGIIGVNTHSTNKIVSHALQHHLIKELDGYSNILSEASIKESRFDFHLTGHPKKPDCYLEVKNVTLSLNEHEVTFPDAVTTRGQKHLTELMELKKEGYRCAMLYVVQREDALFFRAIQTIDPNYASLLFKAYADGVEILCYKTRFNLPEAILDIPLPIKWSTL